MLNKGQFFLLSILLAAWLAGCQNKPQTIVLAENPWPAAQLNTAAARIIIENELGNPVDIMPLDENEQWEAIANGDVDASLEVWPSGHADDIAQYITGSGRIEQGGPLGPVGEIGWYVPTYVIEDNSDLANWQGFYDAEEAFAAAETAPLGRFLGGDPTWTQYDEQIIKNLQLPFQVVWTGSEEALLTEVSLAYEKQEPVLFYFYSPHAIFQEMDLTQVQLPPYSQACYEVTSTIDCAYPQDELFKIFNPDLKNKDNDVYLFLSNMNYSSDSQIEMLSLVEGGLSIEEAAENWVESNETLWRSWLP